MSLGLHWRVANETLQSSQLVAEFGDAVVILGEVRQTGAVWHACLGWQVGPAAWKGAVSLSPWHKFTNAAAAQSYVERGARLKIEKTFDR